MTGLITRNPGRFYAVTGHTAAVVAASLATDTTLMSARLAAASLRKAYLLDFIVQMGMATAGAAGGIATTLGLQRFTTATPTGGTARTPAEFSLLKPTVADVTDMTDVRDSNAALTVTSVVFGDILDSCLGPNGSTNVVPVTWKFAPRVPVEMSPGDGVCLRTRNIGPATATWLFSYTMRWFED